MGFMRRVAEVRELVREMIDVPYQRVRASLVCVPCTSYPRFANDGML